MDTIEQGTQAAQDVRSEPESVRSAKHSRRAFLFKLSLLPVRRFLQHKFECVPTCVVSGRHQLLL